VLEHRKKIGDEMALAENFEAEIATIDADIEKARAVCGETGAGRDGAPARDREKKSRRRSSRRSRCSAYKKRNSQSRSSTVCSTAKRRMRST